MKIDLKLKENMIGHQDDKTEKSKTSKNESTLNSNAAIKVTKLKPLVKYLFNLEKNDRHDYTPDINLHQLAMDSITIQKEDFKCESIFLGVIAKCRISGCDIHSLDDNLEFDKHYKIHEQIDSTFTEARNVIQRLPDSAIGILVYSDHLEILHIDGTNEKI